MNKEAWFYERRHDTLMHCMLCPHHCMIAEGETGKCKVRKNEGGMLIAGTYGRLAAMHQDPIEKKPLYHFYPGSNILSIGTYGCSFNCSFCQNCEISQADYRQAQSLKIYSAKEVASAARQSGTLGIAYTYNEPFIWYEYMYDIARLTRDNGLKNVVVSNGFINPEPLDELLPLIDAFNIDVKSFSNEFYRKHADGRLKPVLNTCLKIKQAGKHLELTHLVVPGLNDSMNAFEQLLNWIVENTGKETVLHISRYFPHYNLSEMATPAATMDGFAKKASRYLSHVYLGNIRSPANNHTRCPECGKTVIERYHHFIERVNLDDKGRCTHCGRELMIKV